MADLLWAEMSTDLSDLTRSQQDWLAKLRPFPDSIWVSPKSLGGFRLSGLEIRAKEPVELGGLYIFGSQNLLPLTLRQHRSAQHRVEVTRASAGLHRLKLECGDILALAPNRAYLRVLSGGLFGARVLFQKAGS